MISWSSAIRTLKFPEAVSQFDPAGLERDGCELQPLGKAIPVAIHEPSRGVDLQRHAGKILGHRVVQFGGKARTFVDAKLGVRLGDFGFQQLP